MAIEGYSWSSGFLLFPIFYIWYRDQIITARQMGSEGYVFSNVCLSVLWARVPCTEYQLPVTGPTARLPPDMFKLVHLGTHCTGTSPLGYV